MASLISKIFSLGSSKSIRVPAIETHDIENPVEKAARTLLHLVKLNHINYSVRVLETSSDSTESYNMVPHHLISAYLFGADSHTLDHLYEVDSKSLEPWKDAPGEVVGSDWMDFLGKKEYERAFLDLFEDDLVDQGYDWKAVLHRFLFTGEQPLISSITASQGQPLIRLALALQMSARGIAMEALTLAATSYYDYDMFKYSDDQSYFQAEPLYKSSSIHEILDKVGTDDRFKNESLALAGDQNMAIIYRDHEAALLDHCNAWTISSDPTAHFHESQKAAVALFLGTKDSENRYDKSLLHPLLMSHAIHVILPHTPDKVHVSLVKQWWLTTLAIYVAQLRPEIDLNPVESFELEDKETGWEWVKQQALKSSHATDAYFLQTLRVLKELGETWEDSEEYYLKAAVKFADDFDGWK